MPKLSVVIPAYNEEKRISACLDALVAQKTDHPFEVVIVDNASTDKTTEIAKTFSKKLNLQVVAEPQKSRGAARAQGCEVATGDWIVCSDADCQVPENWVQNAYQHFESGKKAITGPCNVQDLVWWQNDILTLIARVSMRGYRVMFGYYWLSGFACGFTRELYEKSGGFDRSLKAMEDVELSARMRKFTSIYYCPDLAVGFSGRRFENNFLRGVAVYATKYWALFLFKKKDIDLSDIR